MNELETMPLGELHDWLGWTNFSPEPADMANLVTVCQRLCTSMLALQSRIARLEARPLREEEKIA